MVETMGFTSASHPWHVAHPRSAPVPGSYAHYKMTYQVILLNVRALSGSNPFIINKKASLTTDIFIGGDDGIRTHDPLVANEVLSQLSHAPTAEYIIAYCNEIATPP